MTSLKKRIKNPHSANYQLIVVLCSKYASVAELVDALDSKSSSEGSAGSIPARGTKLSKKALNLFSAFFVSTSNQNYYSSCKI